MPPKPRSRAASRPSGPRRGVDRRLLLGLGVGGAAVLAAAAFGIAVAFGGGGGGGTADVAGTFVAAGCTLTTKPAIPGDHTVTTPTGTSPKWNTSPPTSGPHYAVPAVWGEYTEPVNLAQLVHNLEHGGISILYGPRVPDSTVAELRSFYDDHTRGTVLAPQPSLGRTIALGAWTTRDAAHPADGLAHLARCTTFDQKAFAAFFRSFQFQGPERFPADTLLPGRN